MTPKTPDLACPTATADPETGRRNRKLGPGSRKLRLPWVREHAVTRAGAPPMCLGRGDPRSRVPPYLHRNPSPGFAGSAVRGDLREHRSHGPAGCSWRTSGRNADNDCSWRRPSSHARRSNCRGWPCGSGIGARARQGSQHGRPSSLSHHGRIARPCSHTSCPSAVTSVLDAVVLPPKILLELTSRTLQQDYTWGPMVVLGGGAVFYERGTSVFGLASSDWTDPSILAQQVVGLVAHIL